MVGEVLSGLRAAGSARLARRGEGGEGGGTARRVSTASAHQPQALTSLGVYQESEVF